MIPDSAVMWMRDIGSVPKGNTGDGRNTTTEERALRRFFYFPPISENNHFPEKD